MRAFKSVGGNPIVFESVKGPYAFDVDGNKCASPMATALCIADALTTGLADLIHAQLPFGFSQGEIKTPTLGVCLRPLRCCVRRYIDYIGSWGPAIVGAADDEVNAALKAQIDKGTSYGAPCELEVS